MKHSYIFFSALLLGCLALVGAPKIIHAETRSDQEPFLHDLRIGATGNDVQRLQQYLNNHGAPVAPFGPGSPGKETHYFGPATARAVSRFQELHADVILTPLRLTQGTGNFYTITRNFVNQSMKQVPVLVSPVSTNNDDQRLRLSGLIVVPKQQHAIGGTVSGLSGAVVLQNNGANDLTISADGSFMFAKRMVKGASYGITVAQQPAGQTCTISNGSGIMRSSNVVNVSISCSVGLVSITVSPSNVHLPSAINQQFTALGHYADSSTADITSLVNWETSDHAVATISGEGLAQGNAPGVIQVSAALNGVVGATNMTVTDAILVAVTITPVTPAVARGSTLQLSAVGTFSDASTVDITNQATWTSTATAVATVNDTDYKGEVAGVAGGASTIRASLSGVIGTVTLFVGS